METCIDCHLTWHETSNLLCLTIMKKANKLVGNLHLPPHGSGAAGSIAWIQYAINYQKDQRLLSRMKLIFCKHLTLLSCILLKEISTSLLLDRMEPQCWMSCCHPMTMCKIETVPFTTYKISMGQIMATGMKATLRQPPRNSHVS